MEDRITLDRKSFEALAVDTRVKILKSLQKRRKTLSELSAELGLSVSGVKEHLENLESAALIRKMDDGHKWKYYELTGKGGAVVRPNELKVMILLAVSLIICSFVFLYFIAPQQFHSPQKAVAEKSEGDPARSSGLIAPTAGTPARQAVEPGAQADGQSAVPTGNQGSIPTGGQGQVSAAQQHVLTNASANASTVQVTETNNTKNITNVSNST